MKIFAWFVARHTAASVVTIFIALIFWTIAYFGLLLWAMISGGGIGSPLSYILGVVAVLILGTASCAFVFCPSVGVAEWFTKRFNLPIYIQIPIAVLVMATGILFWGLLALFRGEPVSSNPPFLTRYLLLVLGCMLPLGFYWWLAEIAPLLEILRKKLFGSRTSRN